MSRGPSICLHPLIAYCQKGLHTEPIHLHWKPRCLWSDAMLVRRFLNVVTSLMLVLGLPVHASEVVTLGAEDAWYPYSGVVDGQARGFTVDLVEAAFDAVGVKAKFVPLPYARCNLEVRRGNLLGCFNTARSAIVEGDFLWHKKPMFFAKVQIYSRIGAQRNLSISDLIGKRVAVTNGYEYGDVFDSSTQLIKDRSPNDMSSLRKLALGRVDYAMVYDRVGSMLLKQHAGELAGKVGPAGDLEKLALYIAFSKTFPESKRFIDLFDRGFDIISQNGRLRDIEKRWE